MWQVLVWGLSWGSLYILIAIGFTLILGIRNVFNLAHGSSLLIGAYVALYLLNLNLPIAVAVVVGVFAAALFSLAIYMGIIKVLEKRVEAGLFIMVTFISTILVNMIVQEITKITMGVQSMILPPLLSGSYHLLGTVIRKNMVLSMAVCWILLAFFFYFIRNTHSGRSIMALAQDKKGAILSGVNVERANILAWLIAGGFAGVAGVFWGSLVQTDPMMWDVGLTWSFIIVIIGGIGSIRGSVLGGLIIGFVHALTMTFLSIEWHGIVALFIVVGVLLLKPKGLLGVELIE